MPPSADVIRADFHRIATSSPVPETVEPAVRRLLAEVPLRKQVLDIGCGTGTLARELASKRGAKVTAIDLVPRMIDVARVRTSSSLRVEYRVADIMALSPRGFDVTIAVDALRHLPLAEIADRMASSVVSGGLVLIADGYDGWLRSNRELAPFRVIRSTLRDVLPGVVIRRHLGARYTAIWTKP